MWWSMPILRFVRRRIVLATIFCMSLTYCLLNFMPINDPVDSEELEVRRTQPLIWRTAADSPLPVAGNSSRGNPGNQTTGGGGDQAGRCRNSVQGRAWLVDDRGLVCLRGDLRPDTGCCDPEAESARLYSCATCVPDVDCCQDYEHCVSCCLNPDKRALLERVIAQSVGRQRVVFATVADQFELCLAKCRTDSHSVQHENQYRRPAAKHCYGLTYAHESQRDVAQSDGGAANLAAAAAANKVQQPLSPPLQQTAEAQAPKQPANIIDNNNAAAEPAVRAEQQPDVVEPKSPIEISQLLQRDD